MESEIKVSIICCAYNQENYIEDAIIGFLNQKTDFSYEILISDDASTDRTAEIIRNYEMKYPDLIKPVYFSENQYSKGNYPGNTLFGKAKGKYLAICEGDDYWTSELKLQKQYEALEKHPECDMCAHSAYMVRADNKKTIGFVEPMKEDGILTMDQVIIGGGNFIATNSLFYRRIMKEHPARFVVKYPIDYAVQMNGAMRGGILFLHEYMSAYRRGAENSWTLHMEQHQKVMLQHVKHMMTLLDMVDEETEHRYSESIKYAQLKYEFQMASVNRDRKQIYDKKFLSLRKEMTPKKKLILFLKCYAFWVLKLWQKFRGH